MPRMFKKGRRVKNKLNYGRRLMRGQEQGRGTGRKFGLMKEEE